MREYNIAAMIILALETATRAGSLALMVDGELSRAMAGDATRPHGARLPDELQQFAAAVGRTLRDVDVFAVVTGPGSFTGLRVGIATVQGLALAAARPVIGIPTLDAMASGWIDAHAGEVEYVATCLDGARDDVFFAMYDARAKRDDGSWPAVFEARVATSTVAAGDLAAWPGGGRLAVIGNAGERFADVFRGALPDARIDWTVPNLAAAAARLAAGRIASAVNPHALRPLYVRRPDAELARERQQRRAAEFFEVTAPADVAEVASLQARAFGNAWGAEALGGDAHVAVARLYAIRLPSGDIAAYCAAWKILDELHINSLAVDPRYRRQGLARRLLEQVLAASAAAGAASATLEVRQSNEAGRALYEGLGFRVEGVRPGYYQDPREDALILWKRRLEGHREMKG
jgi:tRNA threonylcarbamoyl adenosine modification protein YeaZ/ribosomal-protein-alanine acetyltransferase